MLELLAGLGTDGVQPAVCGRASRMAYTRLELRLSSIWRLRLAPSGAAVGSPERVSVSTSSNMDADLSPAGDRIAFRSLRSGTPRVWIGSLDGSGVRQLQAPGAESSGNPRWSPDGRRLALHARVEGRSQIYIFEVETGAARRLSDGLANDLNPTWSHDGNAVYFSSNRAGAYRIWRAPVSGGGAAQITTMAGAYLVESPDGSARFFTSGYRQPRLCSITGGKVAEVLPEIATPTAFAVVSRGIYYMSPPRQNGVSELRFHELPGGNDRVVLTIQRPIESGLSVSAGGSALVFSQVDRDESSLMLVEGFR
jgi:Tol biopolymer transport system component